MCLADYELAFHGDGLCDDYLNTELCKFDRGDCCGEDVEFFFCSICACLEPNHELKDIAQHTQEMLALNISYIDKMSKF